MSPAVYMRRKLAGQCVYRASCTETPPEDTSICRSCCAIKTIKQRAYRLTAYRDREKQLAAERRAARVESGKCARCNKTLYMYQLCRKHYEDSQAWNLRRRRRNGVPKRDSKCGHCSQAGHYRTSCPARFAVGIDSYAAARRSVDL